MPGAQAEGPSRAAAARGEDVEQVLDRNFVEILQELRVAQTGVSILFAFLLGIAFTAPFEAASALQRTTYVVTLLLTAGSSGLLIAPVAFHRILFRRRRRHELVDVANRLALGGLVLLLLAMVGAVLLVLDVVVGGPLAWGLAGGTALWLAWLWVVLPLLRRWRGPRPTEPTG
jgi:Family of unknown function (DUF6328)